MVDMAMGQDNGAQGAPVEALGREDLSDLSCMRWQASIHQDRLAAMDENISIEHAAGQRGNGDNSEHMGLANFGRVAPRQLPEGPQLGTFW